MGKHNDPSDRTGNPDQGRGRHVDTERQPTGRDPGMRDRTPDDHYGAIDSDMDRGDPHVR